VPSSVHDGTYRAGITGLVRGVLCPSSRIQVRLSTYEFKPSLSMPRGRTEATELPLIGGYYARASLLA